MTQEENNDPKSPSKINQTKLTVNGDEKKKTKTKITAPEFMTRIVIRQLPPSMTEEQFLEVISPLPEHNEFYYVNGDLNLNEFAFSRAYVKFKKIEDVLLFKDKYDDYVFIDSKGNEYPAIVEYAPMQKLPRRFNSINIKKNSKINTIESDPDFILFKEEMENSNNSVNQITAEQLLEEIENKEAKENASQMTPLIEFLNKKRLEKMKTKEDKKRKKEENKKKREQKKEENKKNDKKNKNEKIKAPAKETKKQEPKIIIVNNKNESAKDQVTIKCEENLKSESSKNEISTNNKSNVESEKQTDKDSKELGRIRNKDRPTREIYRPIMARQKNQTNNGNKEITSQKEPVDNLNSNNNNNNRKNQTQQKYRNRVFSRTKN